MESRGSLLLSALFVAAVLPSLVESHPTPCNQGNDTMCVEGVRREFERLDYWFGETYATNCPLGTARNDFACANPDTVNKNIATRMLRTANYNVENITQFLRIRWHTPKGHYKACGHVYEVEDFSMSKDLDNTHTIYYDSWIMAHQPRIMFDAMPGHRYTIVAYDAGNLLLGGIWTNLIGGDLAFGQELFPYNGPAGAMYEKRNPYVFALFEQTGIVNVEGEKAKIFQSIRDNNGIYHLNNFINSAKLEGPIGIGYVVIKSDAYGIQRYLDENVVNKCPHLVAKNKDLLEALKGMNYELTDDNSFTSYRGTFLTGLDFELRVTYFSSEETFTACCEEVRTQEQAVVVDPQAEEPIKPLFTRSEPEVQLNRIELGMHMQNIGRYFMLFMVDITDGKYSLEWQVANIRTGDSSSGDEVIPYRLPLPKKNETRTYAFFLITQPTRVQAESMWVYTGGQSCPPEDFMRCNFDLGAMIKGMGARLVGVSMFHSELDSFARAVMYGDQKAINMAGLWELGEPIKSKDEVCSDVKGYQNPCRDRDMPCPARNNTMGHHDNHHDDHYNGHQGHNSTNSQTWDDNNYNNNNNNSHNNDTSNYGTNPDWP